jgi:hypothetical protein
VREIVTRPSFSEVVAMARVRWDRMKHYRNQRTYQAIECENARAAMGAQEQRVAPAPTIDPEDRRDAVEMARAATAALHGEAA